MQSYQTLRAPCEDSFTEKRSEFIGAIAPVQSHEQAMEFVASRKAKHRDARHTVWAYLLQDGTARYSDDGEPQGTGGQPVLEALRRSGLTDACIAVTRYFGGILLGAGGLTRAYANGAALALSRCERVEVSDCVRFLLRADYTRYQTLTRLLEEKGTLIEEAEFADSVTLRCIIRAGGLAALEQQLTERYAAALCVEPLERLYFAMPQA